MEKQHARPRINTKRIAQFAELVKTLPLGKPLNFYSFHGKDGGEIVASDMYPPLHAPQAIEFFFFACLHNYGFWHGKEKYEGPLYGTLDGKRVKGSDLLWKLLLRAVKRDAHALAPKSLANMWLSDYCRMFSDDNGPIPLFISDERYALTLAYGKWFETQSMAWVRTPAELIAYINAYPNPLRNLRAILTDEKDGVPGYREDPLVKKVLLLMMALVNRPERFVVPEDDFVWDPIVDYHLMRLDLRMGHVILPHTWRAENIERRFASKEREEAIRKADFRANKKLLALLAPHGIGMPEVDVLKWMARRFCPEIEKPNCNACMLQSTCAKKVELFQPVIRTTAY
ncbi:MAG: hypothetical protein Q7S52_05660 [bacterium]|nr:hypothetical protein [bacterium]